MKFAGDVVFDVGLGFKANALEEEESVALNNGNDYIDQFQTIGVFFKSTGILPVLKRVFRRRMLQPKTKQFFQGLMQRSLENRAEGGHRDDLIQFLHQLNQKKVHSTDGLLTHAMMFFLDAYDTSAVAMAKVLMELARNADCQEKLRDEIRQAKDAGGGEISYDELIKLPYLEAVVFGSMRFIHLSMNDKRSFAFVFQRHFAFILRSHSLCDSALRPSNCSTRTMQTR